MEPSTPFERFIGTTDISYFIILFVFALIGAFISLRWQVHTRDKRSTRTPANISWKFMLLDNVSRMATTFLLIFIGIRFSVLLLGSDMTEWGALLLGLGLDKISEMLKNATKKARS